MLGKLILPENELGFRNQFGEQQVHVLAHESNYEDLVRVTLSTNLCHLSENPQNPANSHANQQEQFHLVLNLRKPIYIKTWLI